MDRRLTVLLAVVVAALLVAQPASAATVRGGAGNDVLRAKGGDRVLAGAGNDHVLVVRPAKALRVRCGAGSDRVEVTQQGRSVTLSRAALMRRMRSCEVIVMRRSWSTSAAPKAPAPAPTGNPVISTATPVPGLPGAPSSSSPELDGTSKIFGIAHATGAGPEALRAYRSIGATIDRVEFEPGASWLQIDERYRIALREGMRVLPLINQVSKPLSSLDVRAFASFVAAFAARYGPGGTFWAGRRDAQLAVHHIELFNEPYGAWDFKPVEPAAFARLYVAAVDAGRRANARTRYLLPMQPTIDEDGTSRSWSDALFAAVPGIASRVDGLAVHPYGSWAADAHPWWNYGKVRYVFDEWNRRGVPRPVWITEVGQCTSLAASRCVSESQQAQAFRFYVHEVRTRPYIKAFLAYTARDAGGDRTEREHYFGLLHSDLTPKLAFLAYRDAIAAR